MKPYRSIHSTVKSRNQRRDRVYPPTSNGQYGGPPARSAYDLAMLAVTALAACAAAVSCVIAIDGQRASDQSTAAAIADFAEVVRSSRAQANSTAQLAVAARKQVEFGRLQSKASGQLADASGRQAIASEAAIKVSIAQLREQQSIERLRFRPLLAVTDLKETAIGEGDLTVTVENLGPLPALDADLKLRYVCTEDANVCTKLPPALFVEVHTNFGTIARAATGSLGQLLTFAQLAPTKNNGTFFPRFSSFEGNLTYRDFLGNQFSEPVCVTVWPVDRDGLPILTLCKSGNYIAF